MFAWRRLSRKAAVLAFTAWAVVVSLASALLMAGHWLSLPSTSALDPRLTAEMKRRAKVANALEKERRSSHWSVVHVVRPGCRCSEGVVDHLVSRRRLPGIDETVVMAAAASDDTTRAEASLRAVGYGWERLESDELEARFGIVAAPLMIVADPDGAVRYVGGYTIRKQSPVMADVRIVARLQRGESVAPMPVFGCAVSSALASKVDPWGLR